MNRRVQDCLHSKLKGRTNQCLDVFGFCGTLAIVESPQLPNQDISNLPSKVVNC